MHIYKSGYLKNSFFNCINSVRCESSWLLVLFFLVSFSAIAFQSPEENFVNFKTKYIGIEDGLSHNSVTAIHQDSLGFIWIGTFDGLNKFDGYEFTVYRHQPKDSTSLVNNRIESIYSQNKRVFVGTKKGLSIYDYSTADFSRGYFINGRNDEPNPINSPITEINGRKNKIYVGTAGQGLMVKDFSKQSEHFNIIPLETVEGVTREYHAQTLEFDSEGKLWVFVQGVGITSLNAEGKLEIEYSGILSAHSMVFGEDSELWIGLDDGVFKYDPVLGDHQMFIENIGFEVKELIFHKKLNQVWAATDGNGLLIHYEGMDHFTRPSRESGNQDEVFKSNSVYALYLEDNGRKWIGTRGGLNLILNEERQFKTVSKNNSPGLPSNFILSFSEENPDKLWIGTDGKGLSLYDRKTNQFSHYMRDQDNPNSLSSNFITSLRSKQQGLWIGTYGGGVNLFNPSTGKFKNYLLYNPVSEYYANNVWVLFEDESNRLWAATSDQEGLFRYNPSADNFEYVPSGVTGVLSLAQRKKDEFWIGTFDGLYKYDLKDGINRSYAINFPVRSLKFVSENYILIGTEGGGLILLNVKSGYQKVYTQQEGLPNNSILNILKDEFGYFWLSTYKGISKFNLQKKEFTNYFTHDGLQSNQFNYNAALKLSTGELLFGGINGFTIIDPTVNTVQRDFPNLRISQIKINNVPLPASRKPVQFMDGLELPYDKSMLSIEYVALEYTNPQKISYAYFLEGWDMEWHYVEESRVANYSKLPEGDYVFHVKSTNTQGIWNENTLSFPIQILPPWYRTILAYIIYFLFFCAIIVAIISYQRREARLKYKMELSKQMAIQEKTLNEKKFTFFTNISHEFRSPLTMIINPLKDIIYGKDQEIDPGSIEVVYHNARRLLSLVDQLMLFRKVDSDTGDLKFMSYDVVHLCKEVYTCFIHQARTKEIKYDFKADISELNLYMDRQKMEIALFNLISNALKFTAKSTGVVNITFSDLENKVVIDVADNGQGIPIEEKDRIFDLFYQSDRNRMNKRKGFGIGLYLVKEIIGKHGGRVICLDNEMDGTTFRIELLKGKEHLKDYKTIEKPKFSETYLTEIEEEKWEEKLTHPSSEDKEPASGNIVQSKKMILVVDDNPQIRSYLDKILSDLYIVTETPSAEAALEILKQRKFDFIISDVVMEEMNGVEFCKIIKNDDALKHIPVILLTAGTSEDLKLTGVEVGADDYITKPFDSNYLKARIKGILKRREVVQDHIMRKVTNAESDIKLSEEDKIFIDKVIEVVESNLDNEDFNVKNMAREVGMSQSLIYKKIKQFTGKSINEFIRFVRLRKVANMLLTADIQVNKAASNAGFGDLKYFRQQFKQQYKMTPSAFRKKYKNIRDKKYILNRNFTND